jgi:flagellum-specific peptidoglycan hydrolase FlgJ
MNEQRQKALSGIIRYADGQAIRANQLSEELDEMIRLQDDPSAEAQQRLQIMQNEMEIKQRMFDERESFIQHLCTRPRLVEEKLGVLARTIAYYLD